MKKVAVLCGGNGTRLGLPIKCLAEVAGRPFLDWKLEQLERHGADDIVLLVAHGADEIRGRYGDRCRYYEDDGNGPWEAHTAASLYGPHWVTYGDVLLDAPLTHADYPYMYVTANSPDEPYNLARVLLDCGLYYIRNRSTLFRYRHTPHRTWQINDPESLRRADAHLRRHGLS